MVFRPSALNLQEVRMLTPSAPTDADLALAAELGQQLRVDSVRSSTSAGSGPPTSSMSAADLRAVLLHECLTAADQLARNGISARVIDLYSVKPVDTATLTEAAAATGGRLVIAEDHHPEGGLGSAVVDALTSTGRIELAVAHLAVREMPGSGTSAELLDAAGIDAAHIAEAARLLA